MEYHHTGVGTIVQSTWWVQCIHVHVVYGYVNRKGDSNIAGVGGNSGWGEWGRSGDGPAKCGGEGVKEG